MKSMEEWYSISKTIVKESGGLGANLEAYIIISKGILNIYSSIESMLNSVYPEYPWDTSKFSQWRLDAYWIDKKNQREFLDRFIYLTIFL